jgi:hypothetical protein
MKMLVASAALLGLLGSETGSAQDGPKRELKLRFAKGDAFPMKIDYRMSVKLNQIPEIFQGVMSESPLELAFDARLDVTVKGTSEDGGAELEGGWKSLKVKGHVMVNDVDFVHPPAKDAKPAPKLDPALEGDLGGLMNLEDMLGKLVKNPLQLKVDPQGRISVVGDATRLQGPFRALGGLGGALPPGPVGKGDAWKDETKIQIPAGAAMLDVKIAIESRVEGEGPVDGRPCVKLASKFKVGSPEGFKKDDPDNPLNLQIKTEGEGEGTALYAHEEGRMARAQSALKIKVSVSFPNPGGGENIELKGAVKIDQTNEMGGR